MPVYRICNYDRIKLPKNSVFVLDTNVLYFIHAGYLITNGKDRIYSNFIQKIIASGGTICVSSLSAQELLHIIEKKEWELYRDSEKKSDADIPFKQYRSISEERSKVQSKMQTVLNELASYQIDDGQIQFSMISSYINHADVHQLDPMDYFLIQNYSGENVFFITDDTDFGSMGADINVFTK